MKKVKIIPFILVALVVYLVLIERFGITIPCLFHKITKLYCPGCGITRLFFSILKLDFYQAFRYNPLVFILIITYIFVKIFKVKVPKYAIYILLVIVILFGILRNIDTFDYLRPTKV
ncbi:DUF2752 domain-containing protein [bacterium]|nr:DUF2752 domain-containing protein [bacterium]